MVGLELPFQQVYQQDFKPALQCPLMAFPHAFDLFNQVVQVKANEVPCPQNAGLLLYPSIEIGLIEPG